MIIVGKSLCVSMITLAAHAAVIAATRKQVNRVLMRIMIDRRNILLLTENRRNPLPRNDLGRAGAAPGDVNPYQQTTYGNSEKLSAFGIVGVDKIPITMIE